MKKILFATLILSGCAEAPVEDVLGSYRFNGNVSFVSTCADDQEEASFIFEILSETDMQLNLDGQLLTGDISGDSFEVTGDNPYEENQILKFTSDDISSRTGTIMSVIKHNPFCFTAFDGVFELLQD